MKRISILGSTGSIGTQTLEVVEKLKDKFEVNALSGGNNIALLMQQIQKFNPKIVCVKSHSAKLELEKRFPQVNFICGDDGLEQICTDKSNDLIIVAVSGRIGLKPTLCAIENKIDVALANKETLVMAGDLVMNKAKSAGANILPIDSEHSAIHQCIKNINEVKKLIITASGGPFLKSSLDEIKNASVSEALAHPRWHMGKKITVDSATLMNKGLEIIEAHHLFDKSYDDIEVVIHPQSYIHSAVECVDGSIIAQIGVPSMHIPIQYAMTYPERLEGIKTSSFSFFEAQKFEFEKPDLERFPCLKLAYEAGRTGGSATICLNAANEEAVMAFLENKISLYKIYELVDKSLQSHILVQNPSLDEILAIDAEVRLKTRELM